MREVHVGDRIVTLKVCSSMNDTLHDPGRVLVVTDVSEDTMRAVIPKGIGKGSKFLFSFKRGGDDHFWALYPDAPPPAFNSSGSKYLREIVGAVDGKMDVYAVLKTFDVRCPARQHAIKKLLCSGLRGKGDIEQDLKEARDAVDRAIQLGGGE